MEVDKDGLVRSYMTLGQIGVAIGMHIEDAIKIGVTDLADLDQAGHGIADAQEGLRNYFRKVTSEELVPSG